VKKTMKDTTEEVKYGGILFSSGVQFCGKRSMNHALDRPSLS
jgi:hypothetical protein